MGCLFAGHSKPPTCLFSALQQLVAHNCDMLLLFCSHRRAVNAVLQCQPNPLCQTTKTWAGASPGPPPPGTAFSKVGTSTHKRWHAGIIWVTTTGHKRPLSQRSYSLFPGTLLRFHSGSNVEWQDVEDLASAEKDFTHEEQSASLKVHYARSLWLHLECRALLKLGSIFNATVKDKWSLSVTISINAFLTITAAAAICII